jgi:predicted DNA-binding transcriptional regulator YafY
MADARVCAMVVPELLPRLCRAVETGRSLTFDYVNHRGEAGTRRVLPTDVRYGPSEWHGTTWHLEGIDADRGGPRSFKVSAITGLEGA